MYVCGSRESVNPLLGYRVQPPVPIGRASNSKVNMMVNLFGMVVAGLVMVLTITGTVIGIVNIRRSSKLSKRVDDLTRQVSELKSMCCNA